MEQDEDFISFHCHLLTIDVVFAILWYPLKVWPLILCARSACNLSFQVVLFIHCQSLAENYLHNFLCINYVDFSIILLDNFLILSLFCLTSIPVLYWCVIACFSVIFHPQPSIVTIDHQLEAVNLLHFCVIEVNQEHFTYGQSLLLRYSALIESGDLQIESIVIEDVPYVMI